MPQKRPLRNRGLWALYLLAALAPLLIISADSLLRARQADRQALLWFEALDLSSVALYPSGTPQRHPETLWPWMEIRLTPWMPGTLLPDIQVMDRTANLKRGLP